MASVTTNDGGETMASDLITPDDAGEPRQPREPKSSDTGPGNGFFSIYKSGHGYWTRMATAGAAAVIIAMTAYFIWQQLPVWLVGALTPTNSTAAQSQHAVTLASQISVGISLGFAVLCALVVWRLMNKSTNADFLIATDSEMKKVNWTSRKELIGSTKVVIFFMFFIAFLLFSIDIVFGYLFYLMTILKNPPF